jgi:MerR family transcriptional regulator, redox-sensitive transcriptional activator SoxR
MTSTRTMTIGELAQITGLSVSAIRFYGKRGVLPARDGEGWQRFDGSALDRLAVVELAKSAGFDLDEIVRFFDATDADPDAVPTGTAAWQGLAEFRLAEIDTLAARLDSMRLLLTDTLALGYLPADRMHRVPSTLGWTAPHDHNHDDHGLSVPADAAGLAQDSEHQG